MATQTTTTHSDLILTEVLGDAILQEARPKNVASRLINTYSIVGSRAASKKLNRYGDTGAAGTATEGTAYTTEADSTPASAVSMSPTEAAVQMLLISDDVVEETTGIESAYELFTSGSREQALAVAQPFASQLGRACFQKLEADVVGLFPSLSNSVGTTTVDITLDNAEEAIYTLDIAECPHEDYVFVLHPRQVSDLRKDLATTSGGMAGSYWMGNAELANHRNDVEMNGLKGALFGIPVYMHSKTVEQTANASADVVGALFLRGIGAPEDGDGGQPGTFAFCEGRPLKFMIQHELRERGSDLMANWKYAVAERVDAWGVKIVTDA